jgi:hypothetical protein
MIYGPLSYHIRSTEFPLAAGATLAADGQALVVSNAGGVFGVAPSAGAGGEIFAGFVTAQTSAAPFLEQSAVKVDTVVTSSGGTATATFTPLAGTLGVYNTATGAAIASGGWVLGSGGSITALPASTQVTLVYTYALTVAQAVALMGNQVPSGYAGSLLGSVGCSQRGRIYTNQFDTSVNWQAATGIKLAANGKVTNQAGSGTSINGFVTAYPTGDYPYLGIEFDAA